MLIYLTMNKYQTSYCCENELDELKLDINDYIC